MVEVLVGEKTPLAGQSHCLIQKSFGQRRVARVTVASVLGPVQAEQVLAIVLCDNQINTRMLKES